LGPAGTDSEAAAFTILKHKVKNPKIILYDWLVDELPEPYTPDIVLCDSFEKAKDFAIENNYHFLMPAAYAARNNGSITDTWGDFHFREMDRIEAIDSFVIPLKQMCLAKNTDVEESKTILLHPATEPFAKRYAPNLERIYLHSKPLVVQECANGGADMCIGSSDIVSMYDNLEIIEAFTPKMAWVLYQPI
tara:strand:+ start:9385 stop:9957 length:573 start_codon:yes stop_codon:yes gene_type:complete